ncbi:MAG: hypothetical protein LUG16_08710 [Candidatus Gastranaerophilales bacterium]|nr:hypothetical protein [Candidatus Gastranaerophilales bacterium]
MGIAIAEKTTNKEFSPKEIREMLGVDNSKIQELCRIADIKLKKNERGLTYFTQDDAKTLKNISGSFSKNHVATVPSRDIVHKGSNSITGASILQLVETLRNIEKSMTEKVTAVLDEKLDGMDDVVLELIRVKTENETMRFKINELNKENYKLKKEVNSFKKVPFGFYAKTTSDNNIF